MKARHYISTGLLLVGSSISLNWALAQNAAQEPSQSIECLRESSIPSPTIEQRLAIIEACTGVNHGPITGFEPGTTLEEAEELYRNMKLYASLVDHQFDRQEALIESLNSAGAQSRSVAVYEEQYEYDGRTFQTIDELTRALEEESVQIQVMECGTDVRVVELLDLLKEREQADIFIRGNNPRECE